MARCVVFDEAICIKISDISYLIKVMPFGPEKTYRLKIGLSGGHEQMLICRYKKHMDSTFDSLVKELYEI